MDGQVNKDGLKILCDRFNHEIAHRIKIFNRLQLRQILDEVLAANRKKLAGKGADLEMDE